MIRQFSFACAAVLLPMAGGADLQPAVADFMPYMDGVEGCFTEAEDQAAAHACIGQGAGRCMDADPTKNQTTIGMTLCTLAEKEA